MALWITTRTDDDAGADTDKKEQDIKVASTSINSASESLSSPAHPQRERITTWGNDSVQESRFARWDWRSKARWKVQWTWFFHDACLGIWNGAKWTTKKIKNAPMWKHVRWSKKQFYAFCLVVTWVVVPMTLIGYLTPFTSIFADKIMSCGDNFYGMPQNATVTGIEKLFALDATFGRFTFSQVKAIDVLWDLLVGKGAQALAWWASYNVFCDALLRAIERHPASFEIFQRIGSEGPGLHTLWTLTKELWNAKSARTRTLFFYMFWSTGYVLLVPIVLGAMTGYDSTSIAWIDLEGENNIIPASQLQETWVIRGTKNTTNTGTKNETFKESACADKDLRPDYNYIASHRDRNCDCQMSNGTMVTAKERNQHFNSYYYYSSPFVYENCSFNYPNNTQTWTDHDIRYYISSKSNLRPDDTYACNATIPVTINGKTYDADDLDAEYGYCYNGVGYNYDYLSNKSRCLPDTANPSYQWGFATLMSGLFILVTAIWTLSMYVLWQDAQFNCKLVKSGYRLTPLRAAFTMAVAARRRTGMGGKELVRAKNSGLERELYGKNGTRGTIIEGHLFVENVEDEAEEKEDRNIRREWIPRTPLSPLSPAYTPGKEKEKNWPSSPSSSVGDQEIRSLVRSDTDISIHVLDDEELRKRYLRGVEEARLSRKPLSRESTWVEESMWESSPKLPRYDERGHNNEADGVGDAARDGHEDGNADGFDEQSGKKDKKERARLKKARRPSQ
ncbi:hypothetical protein G6011_01188 [Alternaria panax]|uniref:Uncharacterized protein n=1 Tax=Alternaria panax TaxID=48097 RepID=A0AAD4IK68_9PLEO|nr:hypothetical protein G6011_01188 [Alternaria panax]